MGAAIELTWCQSIGWRFEPEYDGSEPRGKPITPALTDYTRKFTAFNLPKCPLTSILLLALGDMGS